MPQSDLPLGVFGENLTTSGLLETQIRPGDRLRIGSGEFEVTIPRFPCFKLGIRFGRKDILKRYMQSGPSGFYLKVLQTGELEAGDQIVVTPCGESRSIADKFLERVRKQV